MSSKTSIILCTYNEANYIEHAILELEKNIPNLEIVIVDDCSSDGSRKLIKDLKLKISKKVDKDLEEDLIKNVEEKEEVKKEK